MEQNHNTNWFVFQMRSHQLPERQKTSSSKEYYSAKQEAIATGKFGSRAGHGKQFPDKVPRLGAKCKHDKDILYINREAKIVMNIF